MCSNELGNGTLSSYRIVLRMGSDISLSIEEQRDTDGSDTDDGPDGEDEDEQDEQRRKRSATPSSCKQKVYQNGIYSKRSELVWANITTTGDLVDAVYQYIHGRRRELKELVRRGSGRGGKGMGIGIHVAPNQDISLL